MSVLALLAAPVVSLIRAQEVVTNLFSPRATPRASSTVPPNLETTVLTQQLVVNPTTPFVKVDIHTPMTDVQAREPKLFDSCGQAGSDPKRVGVGIVNRMEQRHEHTEDCCCRP